MPAQYIVTGSDGEAKFLIETVPVSGVDEQLAALRGADSAVHALDDLRSIGDAVVSACESVIARVRSGLAELAPEELELTFGVSVSAEAGMPIFSKVGGDATFEVRALWKASNSSG